MRTKREARSPYVIQGFSVTVRGRSKLKGEGDQAQGKAIASRRPAAGPRAAWHAREGVDQESQEKEAGIACDASSKEVYISAPLQQIRVVGY